MWGEGIEGAGGKGSHGLWAAEGGSKRGMVEESPASWGGRWGRVRLVRGLLFSPEAVSVPTPCGHIPMPSSLMAKSLEAVMSPGLTAFGRLADLTFT